MNLTDIPAYMAHVGATARAAHLATIGFYTLRTRSNLVEIRSVLDR